MSRHDDDIFVVSVVRSVGRSCVRFVRAIRSVRLDERVSIVDGETNVDVRGATAHTHTLPRVGVCRTVASPPPRISIDRIDRRSIDEIHR
jgi:hypothetical protein